MVMMPRLGLSSRPPLGRYLIVLAIGALGWTAYVAFGYYQLYATTGVNAPGIMMTIRNGLLGLLALVVLAFGLHWVWRDLQAPDAAAPKAASGEGAANAEHAAAGNPAVAQQLAQQGQRYVLEVRSLGLVIDRYGADDIRDRLLVPGSDTHTSILSKNPKDYPYAASQREDDTAAMFGVAFGDAAAYGVERWPIPAFALGPPKDKDNTFRAADDIADGRQKATLGVTLLLWQEDANTLDAQPTIDQLFTFFDAHPDVPEAIIFSEDGDITRWGYKKPGHGLLPNSLGVPSIPDSMVALLVSRSDRVDHLVRPYAVSGVSEGVNLNDTQYDVIKLWNFFWDQSEVYDTLYEAKDEFKGADYVQGPGVPKADWWITQLSTLWKTTTNQGPGNFKPSPYLPIRWTDWQVKQFDSAPRIGYLHRPVHVKLTDEHGKPLPSAEQVKALQEGWQQALGTLGEGDKPARVFYDTSGDRRWITPLTLALHGNSEGIDLEDAKQGYDIGRRIADTGVSSPLVQVGLALVAGYDDGKSSATINRRPNGDASILMVSPPDTQSKAANPRKDPFAYRGR